MYTRDICNKRHTPPVYYIYFFYLEKVVKTRLKYPLFAAWKDEYLSKLLGKSLVAQVDQYTHTQYIYTALRCK